MCGKRVKIMFFIYSNAVVVLMQFMSHPRIYMPQNTPKECIRVLYTIIIMYVCAMLLKIINNILFVGFAFKLVQGRLGSRLYIYIYIYMNTISKR